MRICTGKMAAEPPPPPGIPLESSYKNRLQEFTQRASIPLPIYQTLNEGSQHGPIFRSQVWVDETCFISLNNFPNRKMSEQDVAKLALVGIVEKVKNEGHSRVMEDTIFCKSIINEYALKMNLKSPIYETKESKALVPIFVSTLVLNGVNFIGDPARTKKEAEQFAARSAILSILGSGPGTTMLEIVKSKFKLYDAMKKVEDSSIVQAGDPPAVTAPLDGELDTPAVKTPLDDALVSNMGKEVEASGGRTISELISAITASYKVKSSSVVQDGDPPAVVMPLGGALISSNKRKEIDVSEGHPISDLISAITSLNKFKGVSVVQAGGSPAGATPLGGAQISSNKGKEVDTSVIQAGDLPAVTTPLGGALVSSNKGKEVEVSGGSISDIISAIIQLNKVNDLSVVQAGDSLAVAIPLDGALSSNKGKEVEFSGGNISDIISSIIQSGLFSIPAIQLAFTGSPNHHQRLQEFKKPKLDDSPSVAIDPQQGSENPETSARGRKRKNRKAKKKLLNNQAVMPVALVPHGQSPVFSVAE